MRDSQHVDSTVRPCRAVAAACGAALIGVLVAGTAVAAAPIEILKEMPAKGSVHRGDIVYVDDGRCPSGEVKKIIGGDQMTGLPRQVSCVKRPEPSTVKP